jgi:hypothetical protein
MSRLLTTVMFILLSFTPPALGQSENEDLDIFGYFQAVFDHSHEKTTVPMFGTRVSDRNTFLLQQLNVLGAKRFNVSFSCFVNLEITNSFSSDRNWGTFNLEEAWLKYEFSDALNVKAGLLIPMFNNLHEIKNRTPLLPYIVRPLVYEATASDIFNSYDFLPEKAFVQIYGFVPLDETKIDYAAYVGNSETPWINSSSGAVLTVRGLDTTTFKLLGTRVGVRSGRLKTGLSMTVDKDNQVRIGLGAVHRLRFGGDLSYQLSGFTFEGEVIAVNEHLTSEQQAKLEFVSRFDPRLGTTLDKLFYYGNLNYDFTEKLFGYVGYQHVNNNWHSVNANELAAYTIGGGFRVIESVVLKAQYLRLKTTNPRLFESTHNRFQAAVSVVF